jgi:hypothetical protein
MQLLNKILLAFFTSHQLQTVEGLFGLSKKAPFLGVCITQSEDDPNRLELMKLMKLMYAKNWWALQLGIFGACTCPTPKAAPAATPW